MNTRNTLVSLCLLLLLLPQFAIADIVLVANPKAGIGWLTREDVVNIYLGRYRRLESGLTAEPIDLGGEPEIKAMFYRKLVDKSLAEINAYWSRLVFSGQTPPPQLVVNADEALRRVAARPGALAYVERSKVDKRVRVVFEFGDE